MYGSPKMSVMHLKSRPLQTQYITQEITTTKSNIGTAGPTPTPQAFPKSRRHTQDRVGIHIHQYRYQYTYIQIRKYIHIHAYGQTYIHMHTNYHDIYIQPADCLTTTLMSPHMAIARVELLAVS